MVHLKLLVDKIIGNFLVSMVLITIMLTSMYITLAAYANHRNSVLHVESVLEDVSNSIHGLPSSSPLKSQLETSAERLELVSKKGIEESTITFLFSIFSTAIVTAGVYLITRAHNEVMSAESLVSKISQKVLVVGPFVNNGPVLSVLIGHILNANHSSWLLLTNDSNGFTQIAHFTHIRDSLTLLENTLRQADRDYIGIERRNSGLLLDTLMRTKKNLECLPEELIPEAAELISICDRCIIFLQNSDFVARFEKQLKILLET